MVEKKVTLNQIAVLIEGVKSDVKAVAEGHGIIRSEMAGMKEEILTEIDTVKSAVKEIGRKLDEHIRLPAHA